jgi:2-polyprenyl-3-methyl-5-hydroxy-6-metoxy-1,4-benzoquinol methylase
LGYRYAHSQGLFPKGDVDTAARVYRCRSCSLVYNNPQFVISAEMLRDEDSLFRHTHEDPGALKSGPVFKDVLDYLRPYGLVKPGAKALDIGFGIGRVAWKLREQGFEVHGIEPGPVPFEFALKHDFIDRDKAQNKRFEDVDFGKAEFDFIFLEPLTHFTDPHNAILRALEWLKPGGFLHLEVNNGRWLYNLLLHLFYKVTFNKATPFTMPAREPYRACEYPVQSFKVFCKKNNLEAHSLRTHPCDTGLRNKLLNALMEAFMRRFHLGMQTTVLIRKPLMKP